MSTRIYLTEHTISDSIVTCQRLRKQSGSGNVPVVAMNGYREIPILNLSDAPGQNANHHTGIRNTRIEARNDL
jgi:hypothetical protein